MITESFRGVQLHLCATDLDVTKERVFKGVALPDAGISWVHFGGV